MPREPIPSWFFVLVVVRRADEYLLVHEAKHGQLWYLPAGRVEPGEQFEIAAVRETLEEAGVTVRITGVLRIEHTPHLSGTRVRVFFLAEQSDGAKPKSEPDEESLGAAWVRLQDLHQYPLRDDCVRSVIEYLEDGGPVYPTSIICQENRPFELS